MKSYIHDLFKGFIVTVRKSRVVICLGYINAPENFMAYSEEAEAKAIRICEDNGFQWKREVKTEYGKRIVRITFDIKA